MLYYAKALANDHNKVYLVTCSSKDLSWDRFIEVHPNVYVLKEENADLSLGGTIRFLINLKNLSSDSDRDNSFILYPTAFLSLEILSLLYLKLYHRHRIFYELNEVRKYSSAYEEPMSFKRIGYSIKKALFKFLFNVSQPLLSFYDGLICISRAIEGYGKRYNSNTLRVPILTDPYIDFKYNEKYITPKELLTLVFQVVSTP